MNVLKYLFALTVLGLSAGCATYKWTSDVPEDKRTVFVPVFRNDSEVTELGNVVARQVLREFQREGTFKISTPENCALEIQGIISSTGLERVNSSNRDHTNRRRERRFTAEATVSFIDKKAGKVIVNNRKYVGRTTFYGDKDVLTLQRNASGRLAEDIAAQIVDDALNLKWE
jgi:hypothetical protein